MFDAGLGFFHLVFANLSDDYYISPGIKIDFPSFLRLKLMEDGFRYICFVEKAAFSQEHEYQILLTGRLTEKMLKEKEKKKLFGSAKHHSDTDDKQDFFTKTVIGTEIGTLRGYFRKILDKMGVRKDFALICPIGIFADCCEDTDLLKDLINRRKNPNHNIIILTGSVNAAEHDVFFRRLAAPEVSYNRAAFRSPFQNGDLFPEVKNLIRTSRTIKKLIFTYDFLKEAFGERMQILNRLDYESLRSLLRYIVLHNRQRFPLEFSSDYYAALICAWYQNEKFREKYRELDLPRNPFREYSVIAQTASLPAFFERANSVLHAEKVEDTGEKARDIADFWNAGTTDVPIIYDSVTMLSRLPEIYSYLITYRRNLRKHETILSVEEWKELYDTLRFFGRPSYSMNEGVLPHERCVRYQPKIQSLYQSLKKEDWNGWDEAAMRLVFIMYKRCRFHADKTEDEDPTNERGRLELEKCLEAIEKCIYNSLRLPDETAQARFLCDKAESVICRRDFNALREFKV